MSGAAAASRRHPGGECLSSRAQGAAPSKRGGIQLERWVAASRWAAASEGALLATRPHRLATEEEVRVRAESVEDARHLDCDVARAEHGHLPGLGLRIGLGLGLLSGLA